MSRILTIVTLIMVPAMAFVPLVQVAVDFAVVGGMRPHQRGSDWVVWQEGEYGLISAEFVFHPESGMLEGDIFYRLDYRQYFTLNDLQSTLDHIPLGTTHTYTVLRGPGLRETQVDVYFSRAPSFLYPLNRALWQFSFWGFALGAFFHGIAFVVSIPFIRRRRKAWFMPILIAVSVLWFIGSLLRIMLVHMLPPLTVGSFGDIAFQALTLLSCVGWIGFPAILLHKVLSDAQCPRDGRWRWIIYLPTLALIWAASVAVVHGSAGPLTIEGLIRPMLFHTFWYIGLTTFFGLFLRFETQPAADDYRSPGLRAGSAITLLLAIVLGLSVLDIVPLFESVTSLAAGWVIVSAQLMVIGPVVTISVVYLKYGKIGYVLQRSLAYATTLGLFVFAFVGGMALMDSYLPRGQASNIIAISLYVIALLVFFERIGSWLRVYAERLLATDRQQARRQLSQYLDRMRSFLDIDTLAQETVGIVCQALHSQFGYLCLRAAGPAAPCMLSSHGSHSPKLTPDDIDEVWPYLLKEKMVWTNRSELNERELPAGLAHFFRCAGLDLVVPIKADSTSLGLLLLGPRRKGSVYNLEDLDMIRALGSQLALAVERLRLFERQRELVRAGAEARLQALRAQINPHFLFNALNTISALIGDRSEEAEKVVEDLAAIFRHTLQMEGREFLPLYEELALIRHYLSIEQARFGSRLTIEWQLDEDLGTLPIPAFVIQTLVENAVNHGIRKKLEGGTLRLTCNRLSRDLAEILVADTGVGIPDLFDQGPVTAANAPFLGYGLRNVVARLERLYERDDLLRFESSPGAGTTARLWLPID